MRISNEIINDIRESASISEVIGSFIHIEKKGKNYVALCPFHDDHDPSLSISEEKKIYKCFVCGNGGNVFTFVSNYKKINFAEAVKEVADIIGKPLNIELDDKPKKVSPYQKYYDILNSTITYSNYLLTASKAGLTALDYLKNRGMDENIINHFNIGYNPEGNYIYEYLVSQGFKDNDMYECNIVRQLDDGPHDVFYKRILFPIHDSYGNPVGFTARNFTDQNSAKYINTSETKIYIKGELLYNYHRSQGACKQSSKVIICEGVLDVIAFYKAGIENVVATLGTACSKMQLQLLSKLSKTLIFSYDGDKAGKAANLKNGLEALKMGLNVRVIENNSDLDPDEIFKKYGKNGLRDLSSNHIPFVEYAINYYKELYNLNNFEDRKAFCQKLWPIIDLLKDEYDKDNYLNEIYELTKIRRKENPKVVNNNKKQEYNSELVNNTINISQNGLSKAEAIILLSMCLSKQASKLFQKELGALLDERNQKLAILIIDDYRKNNACSLARIYDETQDQQIKNLITDLTSYDLPSNDYDEKLMQGALDRVKREIKESKLKDLKNKIANTNEFEKDKYQEYLQEYLKLVKELGGE